MRGHFILVLGFVCATAFAAPRQATGPQIDVIRQTETGVSHFAVRCSSGVAADASITCKLRKTIDGQRVYDSFISAKLANTLVQNFFKIYPPAFVERTASKLKKFDGAVVHYRVAQGEKFAQGAVSHDPTHYAEDQTRRAMERAGLFLEEVLDNFLVAKRLTSRTGASR